MSEYYYILSLYKDRKRYLVKVILLSAILLGLASFIVMLDIFRISPFIWYLIAMGIVLFQMRKLKPESEHYNQLTEFLQNHHPELLKNDELVFFIDYQLKHYFDYEASRLFNKVKNKNIEDNEIAIADLNEIIGEIIAYYNYIGDDHQLQEDVEISLQWYRNSIENHKHNLV